jgi:hydroxymethylpyrimidine kinase/phosphomethylpyrimidine kinase
VDGADRVVAPVVLTVAGFDPSGGAGIIADVKTIHSFGCRPVAAITSLTFQNSAAFFGAINETAESLRAQLLPVIEESQIAAVKIGMLPTAEMVREIVALMREHSLPAPVVDPVMRATAGQDLVEEDAIEVFMGELMPLARLLTPNIPEAEKLTGLTIIDEDDMRAAATRLRMMGARAVLVKGGHLPRQRSEVRSQKSEEIQRDAIDVLDDDGEVTVFRGEWIEAPAVRGTGCILSAAIAACLAKKMMLSDAISAAKQFVREAIEKAGPEHRFAGPGGASI